MKRILLLAFSGVLLATGATLLWRQASLLLFNDKATGSSNSSLQVRQSLVKAPEIKGAFPIDQAKRIVFQQSGKEVFDLVLVDYRGPGQAIRQALLFPEHASQSVLLPSPTGLRQAIWQEAAKTIAEKAPKDALFLGWWDDSQRLHFLTGRETWITDPGELTFKSPLWQQLQAELGIASTNKEQNLHLLARWLTMDSKTALEEMTAHFGKDRPIYLAVTNDLLLRVAEMVDLGATPLNLHARVVPASDNLHNDISRIKRLAQDEGDGNYLVQKEGASFRLWFTPKNGRTEKNALLVRLLPFVESLKQLPENVQMVYQSHWGGYLSIYRLILTN